MCNFMTLRRAGRFAASAGRPFAAMIREWRIRSEDDALARLDDCALRDVGLDRCEVRYVLGRAIPTADRETTRAEPALSLVSYLRAQTTAQSKN